MQVLRLNCKDRPGIVAGVANLLADHECNIEESSQFNDPFSGQFFMRVVFSPLGSESLAGFISAFPALAAKMEMQWEVCDLSQPVRTLIMVSKADHCLYDLLYRQRTHTLPIEITGIVSNHTDLKQLAEDAGLKFHHLPVTAETKSEQENKLRALIDSTDSELVLLARYMQIISTGMARDYMGRIINIHHSFLPGFKGAKPYTQAYERGVKMIGATAHYASEDLDEGPIIAQRVERVDHTFTPEKMQQLGRHTESDVLARAVKSYCERRIFLHGKRTIIL
jgi:formyltetrahydrofolate deformylase